MGFLDWLSSSANREQNLSSSESARKRLKATIFQDRVQMMTLPPEQLEDFKRELMEVISKYFEINEEHAKCILEQDEKEVEFIANIPVKSFLGSKTTTSTPQNNTES